MPWPHRPHPYHLRRRKRVGDRPTELYDGDSDVATISLTPRRGCRTAGRPADVAPTPRLQDPPAVTGDLLLLVPGAQAGASGQEPPALNPFGSRAERADQKRDDAVPGYLETSDGKVHPGQITLTRDARLKIFDEQQKKHREIPLKAIKRIDCTVLKEWVEEEWRFKENASDEKYFTGRTYPAREYTHTITLQNGQKIEGTLSGIVYVRAAVGRGPRSATCCTSATRASPAPISSRSSTSARSSSATKPLKKEPGRRPGTRPRQAPKQSERPGRVISGTLPIGRCPAEGAGAAALFSSWSSRLNLR